VEKPRIPNSRPLALWPTPKKLRSPRTITSGLHLATAKEGGGSPIFNFLRRLTRKAVFSRGPEKYFRPPECSSLGQTSLCSNRNQGGAGSASVGLLAIPAGRNHLAPGRFPIYIFDAGSPSAGSIARINFSQIGAFGGVNPRNGRRIVQPDCDAFARSKPPPGNLFPGQLERRDPPRAKKLPPTVGGFDVFPSGPPQDWG